MYFNIIKAEYIERYIIELSFSDGKSGRVDLQEYISDGEIFDPIQLVENFKKFTVEFGTLTWLDGSIDIAPETLYEKTTGESVVFENTIHKVG